MPRRGGAFFRRVFAPVPTFRAPPYLLFARAPEPRGGGGVVGAGRGGREGVSSGQGRYLGAAGEFGGDLLFHAEQVGVVLREAADAGHAVELAGFFEAIDRAELRQADRQLLIAAALGPVDLDVVRAVHRLEEIGLLLVEP